MTLDPFRALQLTPKKTVRVCEEIAERWPADGSLPASVDDAAERRRIRELVRQTTPGSPLYRRDALLAATIATDPNEARDWRSHAVDVLAALPKPLSFEPLYALYQHFYTHQALRNTVSGLYVHRMPKPFPETDALAVFGQNPVDGLIVVAFRYKHAIPALLQHFQLLRSAPLAIHAAHACYKAAIVHPLGDLEKPWLLAHSLGEALTALETHLANNQEQGGFLAALVCVYGALSWKYLEVASHPVLPKLFERITQKDMLSKPDERPDVWKFDSDVAALVRRWLNDEKIKNFFDSVDAEPARKIFWRRAVSVIDGIHSYPQCNAFAMKINNLWFVEFGKTGNACYPYEELKYKMVVQLWENESPKRKTNVDSLKYSHMVHVPSRGSISDGQHSYYVGAKTLIHFPTWSQWDSGWHRKFEAYIETFCSVTLE